MAHSKFIDEGKALEIVNQKRFEELERINMELKKQLDELSTSKQKTKGQGITKKGTYRQVGLTFYYMQSSELFPNSSGSYSNDARFIEFLTGMPAEEIRKMIKNPCELRRTEGNGEASTRSLIADLNKIRGHFTNINFETGINKIDKDLDLLKKDLEDINKDKFDK